MANQALSEVDVCNRALGLLQQAPIMSIDDPISNAEVICAEWYNDARRGALASHNWNFAKGRRKLAKLSEAPTFEYAAKYLLPSDYIRLVRFGTEYTDQVDYTVEGDEILTNGLVDQTLPIVYIKDFKIVSKMSPLFIKFFAVELAIVISPFFRPDVGTIGQLVSLRDRYYKKAASVDGQEDKPKLIHRSRMLSARRSSGVI